MISPESDNNPNKLEHIIENLSDYLEVVDFDFPDLIQREVGARGYRRHTLSFQQIQPALEVWVRNNNLEIDLSDFSSLHNLPHMRYYSEDNHVVRESFRRFSNLVQGMATQLLSMSIGDQVPYSTINHVMGVNKGRVEKDALTAQFLSDRMFIQKIFDLDAIGHMSPSKNWEGSTIENITFNIYNKRTNLLHTDDKFPEGITGIGALKADPQIRQHLKQLIDSGGVYIFSGDKGLGVQPFSYWCNTDTVIFDSVTCSFAQERLQKYLSQIVELSRSINRTLNFHQTDDQRLGMIPYSSICKTLSLIHLDEAKRILEKDSRIIESDSISVRRDKAAGYLDEDYPYWLMNELDEFRRYGDAYNQGQPNLSDTGIHALDFRKIAHTIHIPVVIGYDDIKQLRWCDCSFATVATKNNVHLLEFIR